MIKSTKNIMIAIVVIALMIVGIVVINNIDTSENTKPTASTEPIFTLYSEELKDIKAIEVAWADTVITAENIDDEWSLNGMNVDETDSVKVNGLVSTVSTITSKREIEKNPSDLSQYGLKNPAITVNITKNNDETTKLLIGDKSPTLNEYFIMLDGSDTVYTMYEFKVDTLKQPISYYQEFNRFNIDIDDITGIKITRNDETIELKIANNGIANAWSMITPYESMANDDYIDTKILEQIDAIELTTPVDISESGIDSNSAKLELTVIPYDNSTGKYGEEYTETITVGRTVGDITYVGYKDKAFKISKDAIGFADETSFNIVSKLQAFADISEVKSVTAEYDSKKHVIGIKNKDNEFSFELDSKATDSEVSQKIYQSIISLAVDGVYNSEQLGENVLKITFDGTEKVVVEVNRINDLNCAITRNGKTEFTIKASKVTELIDLIDKFAEENK